MRENFFQIYNLSWQKWSQRHGIEPIVHKCEGCKKNQISNIPIASTYFRGLAVGECECGHKAESLPYSFVRATACNGLIFSSLEKVKTSILQASPKIQSAVVLKLKPSDKVCY